MKNGILFLAALTLAYTGFSEENHTDLSTDTVQIEQLDKMVITATRTARKASEIPVSVTVISLDEIKASAARSIDDLIQYAAGVQVKRSVGLGEGLRRI